MLSHGNEAKERFMYLYFWQLLLFAPVFKGQSFISFHSHTRILFHERKNSSPYFPITKSNFRSLWALIDIEPTPPSRLHHPQSSSFQCQAHPPESRTPNPTTPPTKDKTLCLSNEDQNPDMGAPSLTGQNWRLSMIPPVSLQNITIKFFKDQLKMGVQVSTIQW